MDKWLEEWKEKNRNRIKDVEKILNNISEEEKTSVVKSKLKEDLEKLSKKEKEIKSLEDELVKKNAELNDKWLRKREEIDRLEKLEKSLLEEKKSSSRVWQNILKEKEAVKQEKVKWEDDLKKLTLLSEELKLENENLKSKLGEFQKIIPQQKEELEKLLKNETELLVIKAKLEEQLKNLSEKNSGLEKDASEITEKFKLYEDELNKKNTELKKQLNEKEKEKGELKADIALHMVDYETSSGEMKSGMDEALTKLKETEERFDIERVQWKERLKIEQEINQLLTETQIDDVAISMLNERKLFLEQKMGEVDNLLEEERERKEEDEKRLKGLEDENEMFRLQLESLKKSETETGFKQEEFEKLSEGFARHVRNALGSITGAAKLSLEMLKPSPELKKQLEIMLKNSEAMRDVLTEFLETIKLVKLNLKVGNITDVLDMVISAVEDDCISSGINIVKELQVNIPELKLDSENLFQSFLGIVDRSIESTPSGGNIFIKAEFDKGREEVVIKITDTGKGINEEEFSLRKKEGGFGLLKAKKIIELHKGKVFMETEKNKRTTITIKFPLGR